MEKLQRACAYCRVTTWQEKQETSINTQVQYFYDKIENDPNLINAGIYVDQGVSGMHYTRRKEFQRMLADCKAGKIDVIYCKSVARFGRNVLQTMQTIEMLRELGIPVIFEMEGINTMTDATMNLVLHSYLSQDELEKDIQYSKSWSQKAMEQGKFYLNGNNIYGYDYRFKDGMKLYVKPEEAKNVKWMYESYANGMRASDICKELNRQGLKTVRGNPWSVSALMNVLHNEKYKGDILLDKSYNDDRGMRKINYGEKTMYYVEKAHEPIVSDELWQKVQDKIASKRHVTRKELQEHEYDPFRQICFCGECGSYMHRSPRKHLTDEYTRIAFRCGKCEKYGAKACRNNQSIKVGVLRDGFVACYNKFYEIKNAVDIDKYCKNAEIDAIKTELDGLLQKEKMFMQLKANDCLTYRLGEEYKKLVKKIVELQNKQRDVCEHDLEIRKSNTALLLAKNLFERYKKLSNFETEPFVQMIEKIIIHSRTEFEYIFKCGLSMTVKVFPMFAGKDEIEEVIVNDSTKC